MHTTERVCFRDRFASLGVGLQKVDREPHRPSDRRVARLDSQPTDPPEPSERKDIMNRLTACACTLFLICSLFVGVSAAIADACTQACQDEYSACRDVCTDDYWDCIESRPIGECFQERNECNQTCIAERDICLIECTS